MIYLKKINFIYGVSIMEIVLLRRIICAKIGKHQCFYTSEWSDHDPLYCFPSLG